jgi:glycosyltransferase involved in cell wall biosynthesis
MRVESYSMDTKIYKETLSGDLDGGKPLVSVIIPTKNSSKTLTRCLDSLKNQVYKNTEIIIVDNYSTDNTLEIAKLYTNNVYSFSPERSSQINYGVRKS